VTTPNRAVSQRYTSPVAVERMEQGRCPECGGEPFVHGNEQRFWMRGPGCDLLDRGVQARIDQYRRDLEGTQR
jgi:hypothetical protein